MHYGWKNYETWLVMMWINNEEYSQLHWQAMARTMTCRSLAENMKDEYQDSLNNTKSLAGIWLDLITSALEEVCWREIAEHFIEEVTPAEIEESCETD